MTSRSSSPAPTRAGSRWRSRRSPAGDVFEYSVLPRELQDLAEPRPIRRALTCCSVAVSAWSCSSVQSGTPTPTSARRRSFKIRSRSAAAGCVHVLDERFLRWGEGRFCTGPTASAARRRRRGAGVIATPPGAWRPRPSGSDPNGLGRCWQSIHSRARCRRRAQGSRCTADSACRCGARAWAAVGTEAALPLALEERSTPQRVHAGSFEGCRRRRRLPRRAHDVARRGERLEYEASCIQARAFR